MRIDDFFRDASIKPDTPIRENAATGAGSAADKGRIAAGALTDAEISLPDLLQAFGRLVTRRQQLMDLLPAAVRERVYETAQTGGAAVSSPGADSPIPRGVSGLVRDNRVMLETIRLISSELKFIERMPELTDIFISNPSAPVERALAQARIVTPPELQAVVDESLNALQHAAVTEKSVSTPAVILATLLDRAIQSGTVGKELARWTDTVAVALDQVAGEPEVPLQLAGWLERVDPRVVLMAETSGKPELVRIWAATQAWGASSQEGQFSVFARSGSNSSTVEAGTPTFHSDGVEVMKTVLQSLAAEMEGGGMPQAVGLPATATSRAGRFELLLSVLGSRPEALSKLVLLLPEAVAAAEKKLPIRNEGKASTYDKLARSAPKWLISLAERENKPELLEFWIAAKAADLAPWLKLGPVDRQQLTVTLEELASTFEQPETFRPTGEDSASRGLMLQASLYAPGQEKPYPAIIQIFEEKKERGNEQLPEQEVWVRVSMETHNIGAVDLSFRLQDKKYLTIFSRFADPEAASGFRSYLPEMRKEFAATHLELKKIAVMQKHGVGGTEDG